MKQQLRAGGRRVAEWVAPTVSASLSDLPALRREVDQLHSELSAARHRVATLEAEVQETRRLNRHVAEMTDLVQEVLLPATQRDDERLRERLDKYANTF